MMPKIIVGVGTAGLLAFGATQPLVPYTPDAIVGRPLYDTPSGALDVGYYEVTKAGPVSHLVARKMATSTYPDGLYPGAFGTEAHVIGTRYFGVDANGNELSSSDDQQIGILLKTTNAPFPIMRKAPISI